MQEQGAGNPAALLQQLQAAQGSPRQQALLLRMLQDSVLGAAVREPIAARVLPALPFAPASCAAPAVHMATCLVSVHTQTVQCTGNAAEASNFCSRRSAS